MITNFHFSGALCHTTSKTETAGGEAEKRAYTKAQPCNQINIYRQESNSNAGLSVLWKVSLTVSVQGLSTFDAIRAMALHFKVRLDERRLLVLCFFRAWVRTSECEISMACARWRHAYRVVFFSVHESENARHRCTCWPRSLGCLYEHWCFQTTYFSAFFLLSA